MGQGATRLVARWPALWPIIRRPIRRFFDRLADGWDERVEPDSREHLGALAASFDRLEGAPPTAALDIGTGTGAAALMIARRFPGARVVGIDISPRMIDAARVKVPAELGERVEFSVADAGALPFGDDRFDLVVQISVPVFFDEIARVLRPGGHVAIVSSLGSRTPFHTPEPVLRERFASRGVIEVATGTGGYGTFFLARCEH
jgi:ubiquinone/menaquinone biosynthesis C-methylase UbiE